MLKEISRFNKMGIKWNTSYSICECFCGKVFKTQTRHFKSGHTRSCGCLRTKTLKTVLTKHGLHKTPFYQVWDNMKQRCNNIENKNYKDYGGRGIKVCIDWESFLKFKDDMLPTYKKGLTLDRINNNLGYSKENCKWSTWTEQANNRRPRRDERKQTNFVPTGK